MALSVREQGEIAYLRGVLGLESLEARVAKLEGEENRKFTLEEHASNARAELAKLEVYGAREFNPESVADQFDQEPNETPEYDKSEVSEEQFPAVSQESGFGVQPDDPNTPEVPPARSSEPATQIDEFEGDSPGDETDETDETDDTKNDKDDDEFELDLDVEEEKDSSDSNYEQWTVEDLKGQLRDRQLPASGTKAELINRLREDDGNRH